MLRKMREAMETIQTVAQDGHKLEEGDEEQCFVMDLNQFEVSSFRTVMCDHVVRVQVVRW